MDRQRFDNEIVTRYTMMYRLAYSLLHNTDMASDAVQDAMLRLWERRATLDNVENIGAYCSRTVRNIAIDIARRKESEPRINPESIANTLCSDATQQAIDSRDDLSQVIEAMAALPDNQQTALRMSVFNGMSNADISLSTGLSEANIRTLLSRSRKKLKSLFN